MWGDRVWSQSMNDGDRASLSEVDAIPFTGRIRIDLYDDDTLSFDRDDHLGRGYARDSDLGEGPSNNPVQGGRCSLHADL